MHRLLVKAIYTATYVRHTKISFTLGGISLKADGRCVVPGLSYLLTTHVLNACQTHTINLFKSTFNLTVTLSLNLIPHKNN